MDKQRNINSKKSRKAKIAFNVLYVVVVVGIVFAVWAVAAKVTDSEFVLPTISQTFGAFGTVLSHVDFWRGIGGTMLRCVLGFAISVVIAAVLFYFSTAYRAFGKIVEPLISALRTLPTLALALILAIWVGGYVTPVVLGVLVIMPILYSAARAQTASVSVELKEICKICGANKWQTFRALWFPNLAATLPETLSSAFSYNIKAVIGAEILATTAGSLGMLMNLSFVYLQISNLIALTFIAVVVSVLCEYLLKLVLRIVFRKYE